MKTIKVVAAVICDNMKEKNKIFATCLWRQPQPVLPSVGAQQGASAGAGEQCGQLPSGILFTSLMVHSPFVTPWGYLVHSCIIARLSCFCK